MPKKLTHTPWIYPFVLILLLYATLSFYQLNLPGLHYDEAFEAVPALQLLLNRPVTAFRDSVLTVGPYRLPLMTQDYIGALNTYAALPFIALFGSTPFALRTMSVITGAVTLGLTCLLAYRLTYRRWVGLMAMLILAVDPTFIFWNRQGVFVTAITASIGLAAVYCWVRRFQGRSPGWSLAGAFLFGLGIYAKFLFVWLIAALAGAVILLNIGRLVKHRAELSGKIKNLPATEILVSLPAFLAGCSPLIIYNLQTGGTFLNVTQNASTSYYGVNNLAVGPNLLERLNQFATLLNGSHLWYLGGIYKNFWYPTLFVGVLVGVGVGIAILATRNNASRYPPLQFSPIKIALFPYLVIGLVIFASVGTVSALWITHFAILMPWPALAIAVGAWFVLPAASNQKAAKILAVTAIGLLLVTNLFNTIRYHQALTTSGGLSAHSDAVYDLSNWLAQHAQEPVVAMDWGLAAPVIYLSHGRVTAIEIFGYDWRSDVQLTERMAWAITQPQALYLWRSPDEIIFDRSNQFKALYRPQNLEETIEEAFYERSGRPVLGVTRLVEKGTAANPP